MTAGPIAAPFRWKRRHGDEHPVELRFVDLLLIIVAALMFVAVMLVVTTALSPKTGGGGQPDTQLRVATEKAPAALVAQPYSLTLAVLGGDGPYRWTLADGTRMPSGLALAGDGRITGTPRQTGISQATVQVADAVGDTAKRVLAFAVVPSGGGTVAASPQITGKVLLLEWEAGSGYRYQFQGQAGSPPYSWKLDGALPAGVQFVRQAGVLAGTPEEAGIATFTVTMTDAQGKADSKQVRLQVREAPESWFWTVLGWLKTIITWIGYLLVFLTFLTIVFGSAPSAGTPGLIHIFRRR
ncbi:Ig domain-containing protein [Nonomuraea sediminis]|uniref:Ig domain-containing protein n=1 Tax=Nonomuraea sediminis TaxID=2835864 RepID=UPI001BDC800D|nr:Ig domain-containing protein [Nonomuraea sediminis]